MFDAERGTSIRPEAPHERVEFIRRFMLGTGCRKRVDVFAAAAMRITVDSVNIENFVKVKSFGLIVRAGLMRVFRGGDGDDSGKPLPGNGFIAEWL